MLIAVVLSDSTSVHTPATIFALLLISLFGMCTFTALWLMFADPLRYRTKPAYVFYRDKIIFGVIIFASYGTGLGLYFPSLNSGLNRSTLQLYDAWPLSQQYEYSIAAWIFLVTITVWAMCWIYFMRRTYKKLNKISYIKTRYIQLSFRFFLMQATLIVIYFMAVFIICIIYIFAEVAQNVNNSESITAVISSALYVNALLFGRSLFLPLYCCCLAFLFLPAQMITERNSITSQLAATFVVTEEERRVAVINRQRALKRLNRMQKSLLSNVSSHRSYVFCVQLAVLLTNAATEVYYHTPEAEEATIYPSVSPKTLLEIEDEELFQDAVTDPVSQESKDNNINNHTTITTAAANLGTLHMSSQPDECKASDADTSLFSATDISNLQPKTQSLNPSASVSHKKQETKSTQVTLEDVEALRLMRITSNSAEQFFIDEAEAVAIDNAAESELRPMNFESYGMMYITHIYDEDTDTTCTICREISTRRLVVSFR